MEVEELGREEVDEAVGAVVAADRCADEGREPLGATAAAFRGTACGCCCDGNGTLTAPLCSVDDAGAANGREDGAAATDPNERAADAIIAGALTVTGTRIGITMGA